MALVLITLLTACSDSPERLWLKAPGWSRAQLVGHTLVADPVPVALDETGGGYLFLVSQQNEVAHPRVIALDRHMQTVWDYTYPIPLTQANQPQILWSGKDLELYWINGQDLFHARLNTTGELTVQPTVLSGKARVDSYSVARDTRGLTTVWFAGPRRLPGLYALPQAPGLTQTGEAILVDPDGIWPDVQYDHSGTLHATWTRYPPGYGDNGILYGSYPDGLYRADQETIVAEPRLGTSASLTRPRMGLDEGSVYLFWTELTHAGSGAGQVETFYIRFPPGQASLVTSAERFPVPRSHNLTYVPFPESDLKAGDRVRLEALETFNLADVALNPVQEHELVITFRARIEYLRHQEQSQISTAFFQNGEPTAYQLLSFTPASSSNPAIASDQEGHLYITWLEKKTSAGFEVFIASTAPDIQGALGPLTWRDVGRLSAETLFGLLGGALLVPIALAWMIPPTVVVGLASLVPWDNLRLSQFGTVFSLILAFAAYWTSKLFTLPGLSDYVPFSAWLPMIPPWLGAPLRWGVPPVCTALGLVVAWTYSYRRSNPSKVVFLLIAAAIDGVLTLAIYGVLIYGAV